MPYNPSVNDRSGEILAGYKTRSAEITAAGDEALTRGIVSGVTSAVGGITGGVMQNYNKAQETALIKEGNMGTGAALEGLFKNYGTAEQYQNFITGWEKNSGNANREAAFLSGQQVIGKSLMQMQMQNSQYDRAYQLAQQKAALGIGGGGGSSPMFSVDVAPGVDED
jgi:hypothetical protein